MRAVTGAPWRALGQAGTRMARAWRGWHVGQRIGERVAREPVIGCIGAGFIVTSALMFAGLLSGGRDAPLVSFLAEEASAIGIAGAVLFGVARLVRRLGR